MMLLLLVLLLVLLLMLLLVLLLVQMRIVAFAKLKYRSHITSIGRDREGTGIGGVLGNKGGLGIFFTLHGT